MAVRLCHRIVRRIDVAAAPLRDQDTLIAMVSAGEDRDCRWRDKCASQCQAAEHYERANDHEQWDEAESSVKATVSDPLPGHQQLHPTEHRYCPLAA